MSGLTLLSRILGFARDMIIAGFFGANAGTDAFFVAFKIPNLLRRLFAEGAFAQAFVPVLSSIREAGGKSSARDFIARVGGSFALILSVLTSIGALTAPLLIWLFAPGFHDNPEQYGLSVELLRITFPYLFFICLTAFAGGILNTWDQFAVPAFTPVLLNLSLIAAAVWLAPQLDKPILALGWGVCVAGVLQLAFQLPALGRLGLLPRPRIDLQDAGVRRVLKLMAPAIFGASVSQLNLLINTLIASLLTSGSISWLYYSDRLVEFPLGIFGVGLGTVILPHLSRRRARREADDFSRTIGWALRWLILIGLPATLGLILLAEPLMFTLFQYDQFTPRDASMASRSLMAYGLGLMGFLGVKILVPGFSAREDLRTPARYGVHAVGCNLLFSILLALVLAPSGWGHAGLALAASIAALWNAGLLLRQLLRLQVYRPETGLLIFLFRVVLGSCMMGALLIDAAGQTAWVESTASARILSLSRLIGLGLIAYVLTLAVAGLRPRHLLLAQGA